MSFSATHNGSLAAPFVSPDGLTGKEAATRLAQFGANTMPDTALHPWRYGETTQHARLVVGVSTAFYR